jgi:hypothetical protein
MPSKQAPSSVGKLIMRDAVSSGFPCLDFTSKYFSNGRNPIGSRMFAIASNASNLSVSGTPALIPYSFCTFLLFKYR